MGRTTFAVFIALVFAALLVSACTPEAVPTKSVQVTAQLETDNIGNGDSTILVVDARNNGTLDVNGTFSIQPENDHVTADSRTDVFPVRLSESAGQRRFNLTAHPQSTDETVRVDVVFLDVSTQAVLGKTPVYLHLHK